MGFRMFSIGNLYGRIMCLLMCCFVVLRQFTPVSSQFANLACMLSHLSTNCLSIFPSLVYLSYLILHERTCLVVYVGGKALLGPR